MNRTKLAPVLGSLMALSLLLEQYPCLADEAAPKQLGAPANASDGASHEQPVNGWYLAGGLLTIFAGLGLGTAGIYAALERDAIVSQDGYQRFSEGVPAALDTCDAARNGVANQHYRLLAGAAFPSEMAAKCDEIDTLVAVEIIAFPMSLVLGGLGSFLIVEAFGAGFDSSASITPTLGPGYAGVAGRF